MQRDQKGPFLGAFWLLSQGVKIQKPKTPRELIAGPMGLVSTYYKQFQKDKICKGPQKAHFEGFFCYLSEV